MEVSVKEWIEIKNNRRSLEIEEVMSHTQYTVGGAKHPSGQN